VEYRTGEVQGAMVVEPEPRRDERGWFARLWCAQEFAAQGLVAEIAQVNTGVSPRRGTLRGMHFQLPPHDEVKVVRCFRGAVFDVVVDLRRDSPTWKRWMGVELTAANARMLYVPQGCAHGYLTLEDDTELMYLTSRLYSPQDARGVRYDDPAFGIRWPAPVKIVSAADAGWPLYAG
jgi:dTDP-4-dehydrorhamnose 3,5-epimerase